MAQRTLRVLASVINQVFEAPLEGWKSSSGVRSFEIIWGDDPEADGEPDDVKVATKMGFIETYESGGAYTVHSYSLV